MIFKYKDLELTDFEVKKDNIILYCIDYSGDYINYNIIQKIIPYSYDDYYTLQRERSYAKSQELHNNESKHFEALNKKDKRALYHKLSIYVIDYLLTREQNKRIRFEALNYLRDIPILPHYRVKRLSGNSK